MRQLKRRVVMSVPLITSSEFDSKISKGLCVVKFWADGCGPCNNYTPIFDDFASKNPKVKCFSVDALNETDISCKLGIRNVPLTIVFRDGEECDRMVGVQTLDRLQKVIS